MFMEKSVFLDVLVVYNHNIAQSASSIDPKVNLPFSDKSKRANYNIAYSYFLETCAKNNLSAGFTTSGDFVGEGKFGSFWQYINTKWVKVNKPCYSELIFDKFSPLGEKERKIYASIFSNPKARAYKSHKLFWLFFDKLKTYGRLKAYSIPTVAVNESSKKSINQAVNSLNILVRHHPNRNDFSGDIVVKDRFGAGGDHIYRIGPCFKKAGIFDILQKDKNTTFVLQPFIKFNGGFSYKKYSGFIDIRLIFLRGSVIQAYIRVAKSNEFRCNEHQGGALIYISKNEVPKKVIDISNKVMEELDEKDALFALDFVISENGNPYLMEGNNAPGIDWNLSLKRNELMAKKLIRLIIKDLARRTRIKRQFE